MFLILTAIGSAIIVCMPSYIFINVCILLQSPYCRSLVWLVTCLSTSSSLFYPLLIGLLLLIYSMYICTEICCYFCFVFSSVLLTYCFLIIVLFARLLQLIFLPDVLCYLLLLFLTTFVVVVMTFVSVWRRLINYDSLHFLPRSGSMLQLKVKLLCTFFLLGLVLCVSSFLI